MGYHEALKAGIKIENPNPHTAGSYTYYFVPCRGCGIELKRNNYKSGFIYLCDDCKENKKHIINPLKTEVKMKKLQKAITRIEKQGNKIEEYENAVVEIKKLLERPNWFQSTEEIMVALQLYKRKIPFNHQVKIKNYIVDFVLPKDHIILEVDGTIYHTEKTKKYEEARDKFIKNVMGKEWEVIRVTDTDINEGIKKLPLAIKLKYKNRQRQAFLNSGKLKSYYI
ncbi:MAG: DUF559 domain-containing protein [Phycisphaerae bacterium]|nr:DUF559 domain-containing protein [Phycisphaerae bacterium]MDD5239954.1 DUF559 domain-containing protein [Candidatus Nanoarchaeia archaeon]